MENQKYATAIDEANIGKLVHYHQNGWRIGTLEAITPENVQVKSIAGGHNKTLSHDDVRLVLREAEKPKATPEASALDKSPSGPNATAKAKAKLFGGGIKAAMKAAESGKPENTTPAKLPVAARKERAKTAAVKSAKPQAAKKIRVRHKTRQKPTPKTYDVHFNVDRIVKLYDKGRGKNVSEIAQLIGYPKNRGNNRVAAALIKAGVYKGTRTEQ